MAKAARNYVTFEVPPTIAKAVRDIADKEMCSVSYICRKALAAELRSRGLLDDAAA
jgi:hypothetical protein